MSMWNDKEATMQILKQLEENGEMPKEPTKTYEVQWVRVEHHVALIQVKADNRDEAVKQARAIAMSNAIEEYETDLVYAEEFANDVELIEGEEDDE